jgi:hypothetical protein
MPEDYFAPPSANDDVFVNEVFHRNVMATRLG